MRTYPGVYINYNGVCAVYDYIIIQYAYCTGNPIFGMPAKYIFHSIVVGVEYYNYLFDSGHQETSQSFTMNCVFRPH